jgi:hypothetical protein
VFALDTLFNRVPNWTAIRRVSELAGATDPAGVRLRDALLAQTYARSGVTYHPDWAFHQLARGWNVGAPLSDSYRVSSTTTQYAIQVYTTDTLYNVIPNWSNVRRLSQDIQVGASAAARPAVLSADQPAAAPPIAKNAQLEPAPAPFQILQFAPPGVTSTAFGERSGSKIALILLHGDAGPAKQSLAALTALDAQKSTHYYVTAAGAIYQLVDDACAAWHGGMADWNGRHQNINPISLGLTVEHGASGYSVPALDALAWLIQTLRARYQLPAAAVKRWIDLDQKDPDDLAGFPWTQFQKRLIG